MGWPSSHAETMTGWRLDRLASKSYQSYAGSNPARPFMDIKIHDDLIILLPGGQPVHAIVLAPPQMLKDGKIYVRLTLDDDLKKIGLLETWRFDPKLIGDTIIVVRE